jgi:DNA-binding transcriptional LysR family regulator
MLDDSEVALLSALAESGNLRRAARALARPLATTSRRLIALEQRLGFALYLRRGRLLVATRAGQQLLARARDAQAAREGLVASLRELAEGGASRLVVTTSPLFAELVLPSALAELARRRPNARIEVRVGHDAASLHEERVDLALRRGPLPPLASLRAKKLGRTTMACLARPDRFDPAVDAAQRIAAVRWIRVSARAEPFELSWRDGGRVRRHSISPHVTVDSQRAALELVRRGGFAARLNTFLVRDDLERGDLVEVVPEARTIESVFAVFPEGPIDPRVRELVALVEGAARSLRIWDPNG